MTADCQTGESALESTRDESPRGDGGNARPQPADKPRHSGLRLNLCTVRWKAEMRSSDKKMHSGREYFFVFVCYMAKRKNQKKKRDKKKQKNRMWSRERKRTYMNLKLQIHVHQRDRLFFSTKWQLEQLCGLKNARLKMCSHLLFLWETRWWFVEEKNKKNKTRPP